MRTLTEMEVLNLSNVGLADSVILRRNTLIHFGE
jgi:hypothetical protein